MRQRHSARCKTQMSSMLVEPAHVRHRTNGWNKPEKSCSKFSSRSYDEWTRQRVCTPNDGRSVEGSEAAVRRAGSGRTASCCQVIWCRWARRGCAPCWRRAPRCCGCGSPPAPRSPGLRGPASPAPHPLSAHPACGCRACLSVWAGAHTRVVPTGSSSRRSRRWKR